MKRIKQLPSRDVLDAEMAQARARRKRFHAAMAKEWCCTGLGDWLPVVAEARVPAVEAILAGRLPARDILYGMDRPESPEGLRSQEAADEAARRAEEEGARRWPQGWMVRYDPCAGHDLKEAVGDGRFDAEGRDAREVEPRHELRLLDLVETWPKPELAVWVRPWIATDRVRGWPVELRVWVKRGQVIAVSSYYPQRALSEGEWPAEAAAEAVRHTRALAKAVPQDMHAAPSGDMPWEDGAYREVTFTADYLVVDGRTLWLEGGPGTWGFWGAHPCCFAPETVSREPDGQVAEAWAMQPGAPGLPEDQAVG